jgi:hypothetical protein
LTKPQQTKLTALSNAPKYAEAQRIWKDSTGMATKRPDVPKVADATDKISALCALRDSLSTAYDSCNDARTKAALAVQIRHVLDAVDEATPFDPQLSVADRIAERRRRRAEGRVG